MNEQITLDKTAFKALAVDTRVLILKTLDKRRHTQSELAAVLGLSVPTVKEHLDALVKAGLVERNDEGRKWVYYGLTKKGKAIVNPEEKKFWIVLGTLAFTVVGGATAFFRQRYASLYSGVPEAVPTATDSLKAIAAPEMLGAPQAVAAGAEQAGNLAAKGAAPAAQLTAQASTQTSQGIPWGWIILGAVVAVQLGLLAYFWWKSKQHKKLLVA